MHACWRSHDRLTNIQESALDEAAAGRFQQALGKVFWQLSRTQTRAAPAEVTQYVRSKLENVENYCRFRTNHAYVERRESRAVAVKLPSERRHLAPVRVPCDCRRPVEDGMP